MPMHKKSHLTGRGIAMWNAHKQKGGSWGDFVSGLRSVGRTIYDSAIKPAYQYVRDKPLSTLATASKYIPGVGQVISPVLGAAATLTGKGRRRRRKTTKKQAGGSGISLKGL